MSLADIIAAETLRTSAEKAPPPTLYQAYLEQDRQLVAAGFHPTSDWWLAHLKRFWAHPTAYCLVIEVGRRGGKSTGLGRIAAVEVVDREWAVPPGEWHAFPFFSIKKGEALARLEMVQAILRARGIKHWRGKDEMSALIRLEDRPLEWRALPANFRTAVGFTSVGFAADELARWIDTQASANPATHVLGSVRPSIATHIVEGAHEYLISSPWAEDGAHWEAVAMGDTDDQLVAHGETIEANPSVTEADCRRLCRQEALSGVASDYDRDYRAIAMKLTDIGKLDPELVVWLPEKPLKQVGDVALAGSDLGMKRNSSALAGGFRRGDDYFVTDLHEWQPAPGEPLMPSVVCKAQREVLEGLGAVSTMADGHYRESLREEVQKAKLQLLDAPTSASAPIVRLREVMRDRKVHVWDNPERRADGTTMRERLSRQLKETRLIPTQNGMSVKMGDGRDGSHCDIAAALALMVWQQTGTPVREPTKPETERDRFIRQQLKERRNTMRGGGTNMPTRFGR